MSNLTTKLIGVGKVPAATVDTLQQGQKIMWNYGETSIVESVVKVSKIFFEVTFSSDGETYSRRFKGNRLIAIA